MLSDDTLRSLETEFCGCSLLPVLSSQTRLFIVTLEKTFETCGCVTLQAWVAVLLGPSVFLAVTLLRFVVRFLNFGTICQSHLSKVKLDPLTWD